MSNEIKVSMTTDQDLILIFNFEKKVLEVQTNHWTVITKRTESKIMVEDDQQAALKRAEKRFFERQQVEEKPVAEKETKKEEGGNGKPKVEPNKKVQPTKEELKLKQVLEIFESLKSESFNETVEVKAFKKRLIANNVIESKEFNDHLNKLLSKDLIEESEERGYYKLK